MRILLNAFRRRAVEPWRDAQRDARYAVRLLARAPGFTLAAVFCLAIGTGLTAAMYAQVQSTILADLPGGVRDPDGGGVPHGVPQGEQADWQQDEAEDGEQVRGDPCGGAERGANRHAGCRHPARTRDARQSRSRRRNRAPDEAR